MPQRELFKQKQDVFSRHGKTMRSSKSSMKFLAASDTDTPPIGKAGSSRQMSS
jgi:hypothetical protein